MPLTGPLLLDKRASDDCVGLPSGSENNALAGLFAPVSVARETAECEECAAHSVAICGHY